MADLVLGMGTSHAPQLVTAPELWHLHAERDKRNQALWASDGKAHNFEEVLSMADPSIARELTIDRWQAKYDTCRKDLSRLADTIASARLDALLIVGDDQHELFFDDNMPAISLYWGDRVTYATRGTGTGELKASMEAHGETASGELDVSSALGRHLIGHLMDAEFDVAHSQRLKEGDGVGHAVGFVQRQILGDTKVPILPILVNTYYPPNQPTPRRCVSLGNALREGIRSWDEDARVGIIASGGLSHFVIDEALDERVMKAFKEKDLEDLGAIPRELLNSGNSEIRNWMVMAGTAQALDLQWIDYVPCYRSPAGTGCAMAFAVWS